MAGCCLIGGRNQIGGRGRKSNRLDLYLHQFGFDLGFQQCAQFNVDPRCFIGGWNQIVGSTFGRFWSHLHLANHANAAIKHRADKQQLCAFLDYPFNKLCSATKFRSGFMDGLDGRADAELHQFAERSDFAADQQHGLLPAGNAVITDSPLRIQLQHAMARVQRPAVRRHPHRRRQFIQPPATDPHHE